MSKIKVTFEGELTPEIRVDGQPIPSSARCGYKRVHLGKRTKEYRKRIVDAAEDTLDLKMPFIKGKIGLLTQFTRKGRIKCDVDNVQKSVQDALTGLLWDDDDRVHAIIVIKQYGNNPETKIRAIRLDNISVEIQDGKEKTRRT